MGQAPEMPGSFGEQSKPVPQKRTETKILGKVKKGIYLCRVISQSTSSDKQFEILGAALSLFVKYGFHGTPTSRIAAEAGVANGTLFHYYKTKEDLMIALYIGIKEEMTGYLVSKIERSDSIESRFKTSFIESLNWALQNREKFYYIQLFHFSPHLSKISPEIIANQTRFHLQLMEDGKKAKLLKPLPADLIFTIVSSHVFGLYQYLINADFSSVRQKKVIEEGFEMLWEMLTK
jgi:AcrR family transcriptional regulator